MSDLDKTQFYTDDFITAYPSDVIIVYTADVITAVDKELNPVAKVIRADETKILLEYDPKDFEVLKAKPKSKYFWVDGEIELSISDENDIDTQLLISEQLLEEYPMAEYVFINVGLFGKKSEESNNIYGGLVSYRTDRGDDLLTRMIISSDLEKPLIGKKAEYATDILELLLDFDKQNRSLYEILKRKDDLTEDQKKYMSDFSQNLSRLYDDFFSYILKTESGQKPEPKFKFKTQSIRQNQIVKPTNMLMLKSDLFKEITGFSEGDFDINGRVFKELEYPVNKKSVTTQLMLSKPIEEKIKSILLFPIDTRVFKPVIMRAPLNKYDGKVFKAICTLIDYFITLDPDLVQKGGVINTVVTLKDIHYAMGYKGRLSDEEANRIGNSVLKLSTTQIYYDWNEEREARHIILTGETKDAWGNSLMYTRDVTYMLEAEYSEEITPKHSPIGDDGEPLKVAGFIIKAIPPIYAHAKITKVIASVPLEWFEIKGLGKISDRRNSLLQGLTEKISTAHYFKEQGKNPNKGNYNVIVLDPFFYDCGIEVNNKQTRSRLIKDLETILDDYKQRGIITKYTYSQKASGLHSIKFYV